MPSTIEERILEMRFNNTDFERKASQSIGTLDRLDRSLQLKNGESFGALSSILDTVSNKFSILGTIGDQVVRNLTNQVMGLVGQFTNLVKSMSVDQIAAGWGKYGSMTTSSGTLVSQGYELEKVNEQLDRLNWFTDETSYNLTDMVSNISKFTATGKDLEDSVTAIEGIALWAALSGQNASTASRAMYQLSQAIGGYMRKEDYKSIQNVNMDTDEFRQVALDTAVALGTLKKTGVDTYKSLKANTDEFTKSQFADHLTQDAWLTSDVMMEVFKKYSSTVDQIYAYAEEKGITASEAIQELDGSIDEFGLRAFKAGQEARTFSDAIDSVKDAVSTGWMNTFKTIFGDYKESTDLWTGLANSLYDVFAEGGNERNRILKEWRNFPIEIRKGIAQSGLEEWEGPLSKDAVVKYIDGRDILLNSVKTLGTSMLSIIETVKESFHDIFPPATAKDLLTLTQNFSRFANSLKPSEKTLDNLSRILKGLFAIIDIGRMGVSSLASIFMDKLFPSIKSVGGNLFDASANLGDWIVGIRDAIKENDIFGKNLEGLADIVSKAVSWLIEAKNTISDFFKTVLGLKEGVTIWTKIGSALQKVRDYAISALRSVQSFFSEVFGGEKLGASGLIKVLGGVLAAFFGFKKIGKKNPLDELINTFKEGLDGVLDKFAKGLNSVSNAINAFKHESDSKTLKNIAISMLILAGAMLVLANIDAIKLGKALGAVAIGLGELIGAFKLLGMSGVVQGKAATTLIKLAAAVLILSFAVKILSKIDLNGLVKGIIAIAAVIGILIGALVLLNKFVKKSSSMVAASAAMIGIAFAMILMAGAVALFGLIPLDRLAKGIGAMAVSLLVVTGALLLLGNFGGSSLKLISAAAAIMVIAAAMLVLTAAVAVLALIPIDGLIQGLAAMTAMLSLVVISLALLSLIDTGSLLASAAAMLIVSAALLVMTAAITGLMLIFMVNQEAATVACLAFVGLLAALVVAIMALGAAGPTALVGAAALLVVSVAMAIASAAIVILAIAINMLVGLPLAAIAGGLALIGASMIVLGVGGLIAGLGIIGYAGLAVLGLGLNMLAGLNLASMAGGLSLLGLAFIPLGVGGVILGAGAAGMLAGSVGMAAIGVAMIPLAMGLKSLSGIDQETILKFLEVLAISVAALAGLGLIAEAFSVGLLALGTACLEVGGGIALAGEGIKKIVDSLSNIPTGVAASLRDMASAIAAALKESRGQAVKELEAMMTDLAKAVSSNASSVVKEGEAMSKDLADASKQHNDEIIQNVNTLVKNIALAISSQRGEVSKEIDNMMRDAALRISSYIPTFTSNSRSLSLAISNGLRQISIASYISAAMSSGVSIVRGYYDAYYNAGYYIVLGLSRGISGNQYLATNSVKNMAINMKTTFDRYNQIRSPSRLYEKQASYIPEGAAKGVDKNSDVAVSAIEDMGYSMVTALSPAMILLSEIINGDLDASPSIRPVVDLSDVYASANAINGMFGGNTVGVRTAADISSRMGGIESRKFNSDEVSNAGPNQNVVINNYVYTQPGQNTEEIADAVEDRLTRKLIQKKVAFVR